ncbi:MAG: hypothetical protein ABI592_14170 [Acidobacteriota bacterium]
MLRRMVLAAATAFLFASVPARGTSAPAARVVFRIDAAGSAIFWAADRPLQRGDLLLFHRFPDGTLMSVRRSEVRRVTETAWTERPAKDAYGYLDIGVTGGGSRKDLTATMAGVPGAPLAAKSGRKEPPGPGARPDGTALFNPDRKYQPDIDAKQVPGATTGFPNSANDYREGRTIGYPSAPAVQTAPGEPPRMPPSSGEVPRAPQ